METINNTKLNPAELSTIKGGKVNGEWIYADGGWIWVESHKSISL